MRTAITIAAWSYTLQGTLPKEGEKGAGIYFFLITIAIATVATAIIEDLGSIL